MSYTAFTNSEWDFAFESNLSFLEKIPSSNVLAQISIYQKNKDLFNIDFVKKIAGNPPQIDQITRGDIGRMFAEEKVSSFAYIPINKIKEIIKNQISICNNNEEKKELENAQLAYHNIWDIKWANGVGPR